MGLSIHYSGHISEDNLIKPLTEEVVDICNELEWNVMKFNDDEIEGVSFWPENSEPIFLTFNRDGRILSPKNIMVKEIYDDIRSDNSLFFTTSTKTQFAGVKSHIGIIKLLRHLSKKYMKNFVLSDEGQYWESNDEEILIEQFRKYNEALNFCKEALMDISSSPEISGESLVDKIERLLKEKFGG